MDPDLDLAISVSVLKIWSWDPGSGKNLFRIPEPGVKKHPIPDPQHWRKRFVTKNGGVGWSI
jgi:hypothetical protein